VTPARLRLQAAISGRVQGVGFRWFARERARELGLAGWVRNRADGSLEVVAEGPAEALDAFESALREGPPGSIVRAVEALRSAELAGDAAFVIRGSEHPGD